MQSLVSECVLLVSLFDVFVFVVVVVVVVVVGVFGLLLTKEEYGAAE
jgi:hypothetical protein